MVQMYVTGVANLFVGVGPLSQLRNQQQLLTNAKNNIATGGTGSGGSVGTLLPPGLPMQLATTPSAMNPQPIYLGTTEKGVGFSIVDHFRPIQTDDSGDCPDDLMWTGHEAIITTDVNRWSESVFLGLAAKPRFQNLRGSTYDYDMGTLMLREGWMYILWVQFPYAGKLVYGGGGGGAGQAAALGGAIAGLGIGGLVAGAAFGAVGAADFGGMPGGYRFPCTTMITEGHDVGSRPRKLHLVFHAIRSRRYAGGSKTANSTAIGGQVLYDHNMSGLPLPN